MRVFITRTRTKVINSTAYQLNALVAVLPNLADFSINDSLFYLYHDIVSNVNLFK